VVEGLIWAVCVGAVVAVLLWRCIPAKRRPTEDRPSAPPKDEAAAQDRQNAVDALNEELDALDAIVTGDDPAGGAAEASERADSER